MQFSYDGVVLAIYNYKKVVELSDVLLKTANYIIKGSDFKIIRIDGYECYLKGKILSMEIIKDEIQN